MKCNKCGGLMVYERFLSQEVEDFPGWRCVACGEIVDEVILKKRTKRWCRKCRGFRTTGFAFLPEDEVLPSPLLPFFESYHRNLTLTGSLLSRLNGRLRKSVDFIGLFDQYALLLNPGLPPRRRERWGNLLMIRSGDGDQIINSRPSGIDSNLPFITMGLRIMHVLTWKRAFYLAASPRSSR